MFLHSSSRCSSTKNPLCYSHSSKEKKQKTSPAITELKDTTFTMERKVKLDEKKYRRQITKIETIEAGEKLL